MKAAVKMKGKEYILLTDYQEDDVLRGSFNRLAEKTFGLNFEQWYRDGYWQRRYKPYSLADGDTIVANVSVNELDFFVFGQPRKYVQLGTVMTDPAYQGLGLSRTLMEQVIDDWQGRCELIYLFANDTVLNFYPKFGFEEASEYQCSKIIDQKAPASSVRKLDMQSPEDRDLFCRAVTRSKAQSAVSMTDNLPLIMFYCTSFLKDCIYYLSEYDAAAVAEFDGPTLTLHDLFCSGSVSPDDIIAALKNDQTQRVVLGFTPLDASSYEIDRIIGGDTTLFVRPSHGGALPEGEWMFPELSHA